MNSISLFTALLAGVLSFGAAFGQTVQAPTQYVILSSSSGAFAAGQKVDNSFDITIPINESVTVYAEHLKETKTLKGPYAGAIGDYDDMYVGGMQGVRERLLKGGGSLGDCGVAAMTTRSNC